MGVSTMKELTQKLPLQWFEPVNRLLREPFPFYLNDDRKNVLLISSISLFVIFFMGVYKPFRGDLFPLELWHILTFGGITFFALFVNILVLPKLFPVAFDPVHWTVKKYIVTTLWHCLLIATLSTVFDTLICHCPERTLWQIFIHANTQVFLIGLFPITIITLLLKNNMLQENLVSAIAANRELEKIQALKKESTAPISTTPLTLFSETSETLSFNLPDLLFVEADDNYSTVFWRETSGVQKKLLRANLKNIENQIDNSFTLRCHRSYLVNVNAIETVTGNTNGYKLKIKETDFSIPVSRQKGKEVIEKIQQVRSLMELY